MLHDLVGEFFIKPVFELLCYFTGWTIVWCLTLGNCKVVTGETVSARRKEGRRRIVFRQCGKWHIHFMVVQLLGILFWIVVVASVVLMLCLSRNPSES